MKGVLLGVRERGLVSSCEVPFYGGELRVFVAGRVDELSSKGSRI